MFQHCKACIPPGKSKPKHGKQSPRALYSRTVGSRVILFKPLKNWLHDFLASKAGEEAINHLKNMST